MSEVSERYQTIARGFAARAEGVAADAWSAPTPCTDWTVRDLVAHVIMTHRRVMAVLDGTEPAEADPHADLLPQWRAATGAIADTLAHEQRASTVVSGMFGEQPWESVVGRLVCSDTLIHTWDLARATGQDETLDGAAVAKALESLAPLDEALRRPGGFAPKIAAPPGADAQTEFLNFCGRAV